MYGVPIKLCSSDTSISRIYRIEKYRIQGVPIFLSWFRICLVSHHDNYNRQICVFPPIKPPIFLRFNFVFLYIDCIGNIFVEESD